MKDSNETPPETHERTKQDEVNEDEAFEFTEELKKLREDKS